MVVTSGRATRDSVPAVIDEVGVGAGVFDRLNEMGLPVEGYNGGVTANDCEAFVNLRAESYWYLREMFEQDAIDLDPDDEELAAQLCAIKWEVDSRGRVKVERKEDMRRRGLPSPDRADAVAMALVQFEQVVDVASHKKGQLISDGILYKDW
jgi:phage terminase large subunit